MDSTEIAERVRFAVDNYPYGVPDILIGGGALLKELKNEIFFVQGFFRLPFISYNAAEQQFQYHNPTEEKAGEYHLTIAKERWFGRGLKNLVTLDVSLPIPTFINHHL